MTAVYEVSDEVSAMREAAAVCRAVYGGTRSMRSAGKTYLPQFPNEANKSWESRRDSTALFNAMKKAVGVMVGKPMGSPIAPGEDMPTRIEGLLDNIDNHGRDLDAFMRDVAQASLVDGITWVLADYTSTPSGLTVAGEKAVGARPYLIHIPLSNMLGWRFEGTQLVQLRYMDTIQEPDGEWGLKTIQQVRVWSRVPGGSSFQVQVFREDEGWAGREPLPVTIGEIPCVPFYGARLAHWYAEPPLEDLAWLNIRHWQVDSEKGVSLHHACVPLKACDKDAREDPTAPLTISDTGVIVGLENLRYVEHSGASIGSARQELIDLEDKMRRTAGELLSSVVQKTATETDQESVEGESWLRAWARTFERAIESSLGCMARWLGESSGGTVSLDYEWDDATLGADMITALTNARTAKEISRESYLSKMQEGKVLPAGRTIEQEMDALEVEGPQPMATGAAL